MQRKSLAAVTAIGLVAAIAVPTIAFGNARNNVGNQHFFQAAQTPYVMRLLGTNETPLGDPDGTGIASVTIDIINCHPDGGEICWDLSYSGITQPTLPTSTTGAAGTNGPILVPFVPFSNLGADLGDRMHGGPRERSPSRSSTTPPASTSTCTLATSPAERSVASSYWVIRPPARRTCCRLHCVPTTHAPTAARRSPQPRRAPSASPTASTATGASVVAVPPGATAAIVTLTVTETVAGGFLTMYSAATTQPATSSINWFASNQTFAVSTQVAVDAAGQVKITAGSSSTHFIIDVTGYLF